MITVEMKDPSSMEAIQDVIVSGGGTVGASADGLIDAWVPVGFLPEVAAVEEVVEVRPPSGPLPADS